MRYLLFALGILAGYELVAAISRLSWGGNTLHEDARLNRIRVLNQQGDV